MKSKTHIKLFKLKIKNNRRIFRCVRMSKSKNPHWISKSSFTKCPEKYLTVEKISPKKRNTLAKIPVFENISRPPKLLFLFIKHGYWHVPSKTKPQRVSRETFSNWNFPKPTLSTNRKQPFETHRRLHDEAFALASLLRFWSQNGPHCLIEHLLQSPLCQCRAFHVFHSSYFVGQLLALFSLDGTEALVCQCVQGLSVIS